MLKTTVPLIIASTTGCVILLAWFIPPMQNWGEEVMAWFNIMAAVAFVLGGGNLVRLNLKKIAQRQAGWGFSAITLIAFAITLFVGLGKVGVHPAEQSPHLAWSGRYDGEGGAFWWIVEFLYTPLQQTVFALLAFFIASAAFRAFRAKNIDSSLLLGTAFIVLLGQTYAGIFLTDWLPESLQFLRLDHVSGLVRDSFNKAGMRAITIGIALGIASTSLKVLLSVDRSYLGSE